MDKSPQKMVYPLRLSVGQATKMVGIVAVFIALGAFLALTNRKAVSLFGLVTLSPEGATWMFWGWTAFFAFACLPLALATAWKGLLAQQRVEFAGTGVWLPQSVWSSRHVLIPFADVRAVRVVNRPKQRLLEIELPGRRFWVGEVWLPSPSVLDDILARFREGMAAAKAAEMKPDGRPNAP